MQRGSVTASSRFEPQANQRSCKLWRDRWTLIHQSQSSDPDIRGKDRTGSDYGVCSDATTIANQGAEFVDACFDCLAVMSYANVGLFELVPVVGDNRASLDVDVLPEHAVANEIEMCQLRTLEHQRGFEFGAGTDDAFAVDPASAAHKAAGGKEAVRSDDQWPLEQSACLHGRRAVDRDLTVALILRPLSVEQSTDDLLDPGD